MTKPRPAAPTLAECRQQHHRFAIFRRFNDRVHIVETCYDEQYAHDRLHVSLEIDPECAMYRIEIHPLRKEKRGKKNGL